MSGKPRQVVIVAGEVSGDRLAASLVRRVKELLPNTVFRGVTGPAMRSEGCLSDADIDDISVMGLSEVVRNLPGLIRLRKALIKTFLNNSPDLFIGIDAPEFNIPIEKAMKSRGVHTIHYGCPQAWAWRPGRAEKFSIAMDSMFALLPFEVDFFEGFGVKTTFVGHPLANKLPLKPLKTEGKQALLFHPDQDLVALMPGSRSHELIRHLGVFLQAAEILNQKRQDIQFVLNLANEKDLHYAKSVCESFDLNVRICSIDSCQILTAADVAIVASGTVTLESLLCGTPMVVGYKLSLLSFIVISRLVRISNVALPNILSGQELVPEFIQSAMTAENLADSTINWLSEKGAKANFYQQSRLLHRELVSPQYSAGDLVAEILRG